jgi:hypothetical protein
MKTLKIGVVGARVRNEPCDKLLVRNAILYLIKKDSSISISLISGGCPQGADRFAEEIAKELKLEILIHYPDKSKLEDNSRASYAKINYARNTLIAQDSDILLASPAYKNGKPIGGTADTIKKACALGKPVVLL